MKELAHAAISLGGQIGSTSGHSHASGVSKYEWLFCDVGNTLVHWYRHVSFDIEDRYDLPRGLLLNTAFGSPVGLQAMTGVLSHDEWIAALKTILPPAAVDEWTAYQGEVDLGVLEMLHGARSAGMRVALVSNASTALRDQLALHGIADVADAIICSADAGVAKPDAAIFQYALATTNTRAEQVIYIDDVPAWAEVAGGCGIRYVVYTDIATLRRDLVALGLAWAEDDARTWDAE